MFEREILPSQKLQGQSNDLVLRSSFKKFSARIVSCLSL